MFKAHHQIQERSLIKLHDLRDFHAYYLGKIRDGLKTVSDPSVIADLRHRVHAVLKSNGRVFAFGNGGSFAISAAALMDLRQAATDAGMKKYRRLIERPLGMHELLAAADKVSYEQSFAKVLEDEGEEGDLVLLVSSSGESRNVLEALEVAKSTGMTVAGITNQWSTLSERSDVSVCTHGLGDQQPGEDISLLFLRHVMGGCFTGASENEIGEQFQQDSIEFIRFIESIDVENVSELANEIVRVYRGENADNGEPKEPALLVWGPQGGIQSVTAHHIAHNLQWDALMDVPCITSIFSVRTPIMDGVSAVHYSGVSNDRDADLFFGRQILYSVKPGDRVFLIGTRADRPSFQYAVQAMEKTKVNGYTTVAGADLPSWMRSIGSCGADVSERVYECGLQTIGHLLGRIVRGTILLEIQPDIDIGAVLRTELAELKNKERGIPELRAELEGR